jgi:hypothetical protein
LKKPELFFNEKPGKDMASPHKFDKNIMKISLKLFLPTIFLKWIQSHKKGGKHFLEEPKSYQTNPYC